MMSQKGKESSFGKLGTQQILLLMSNTSHGDCQLIKSFTPSSHCYCLVTDHVPAWNKRGKFNISSFIHHAKYPASIKRMKQMSVCCHRKSWRPTVGTSHAHLQGHRDPVYVCVCAQALQLCLTLWTLWTVALQAPLFMGFSGNSTGVGCQALLQGIFPTQGSNPCLLACRTEIIC